MTAMKLEAIDKRLLKELQSDARLTNQDLASRVGLSASPCWRKVKQLEEVGVIQGYSATLNRRLIGLGVLAFIRVRIDSHNESEAEEFSSSVLNLPEVVACYSIAGDADFLLQVAVSNLDDYANFAMSVVRSLPRIKEMHTTFVLREIKSFQGFPLP